MAELQDSGTRREFDSGAVRDIAEGKGRCDLLPLTVVSDFLQFCDDIPTKSIYKGMHPLVLISLYMDSNKSDMQSASEFIFYALHSFANLNEWENETMILEVSKHFEDGAKKYGERNWEKGIPAHCYLDSAIRHLLKWYRGDDDEPHDRAFVWNLMCLLWTVENRPDCIDIFKE